MTDTASKPKRISKKIKAAINAMVHDGTNITDAAAQAGISREHLSRELRKPDIAKELRDKTLANLAINAARAGATKVRLLECGNSLVEDRASSFILGVSGISPETAPAAAGQRATPPGLQIVVVQTHGGDARLVASANGPHEPRLIEQQPTEIAHIEQQ